MMPANHQAVPIYLAGSSNDLDRVRMWARKLDGIGLFTIVDRWFESNALGRDHEFPREQQAARAYAINEGIRSARIFWLLFSDSPSWGAGRELGYAQAHQWHRPTWLFIAASGPRCSHTIFTGEEPVFRCELDEVAYHAVCAVAQTLLLGPPGRPIPQP